MLTTHSGWQAIAGQRKTGRIAPAGRGTVSHINVGNHRPRWADEHYQTVIFGSNATDLRIAFLAAPLPVRNGEIDNCACIIFHLALQQGSGTMHVPYVMPSRCEAL
jgi:hypothetical protein